MHMPVCSRRERRALRTCSTVSCLPPSSVQWARAVLAKRFRAAGAECSPHVGGARRTCSHAYARSHAHRRSACEENAGIKKQVSLEKEIDPETVALLSPTRARRACIRIALCAIFTSLSGGCIPSCTQHAYTARVKGERIYHSHMMCLRAHTGAQHRAGKSPSSQVFN